MFRRQFFRRLFSHSSAALGGLFVGRAIKERDMAAISYTMPRFQAIGQDSQPLVGAQLYTYQNKIETPAPTWRDKDRITYNTNPIVLDAQGEAVVWLDPNQIYTFALRDRFGALKWTLDNISVSLFNADFHEFTRSLSEKQGPSMVGAPDHQEKYRRGSLGRMLVDITAGMYYVESYYEDTDANDYGPAIRKAYAAAAAAGRGNVVFPPKDIYVRSLGSHPDYVVAIDSVGDNFNRGNIDTIGFGRGDSKVILEVDAGSKKFFGFTQRLNFCGFQNITINANDNASHAFYAGDEWCPYLTLDRAWFRNGIEQAAEIATYVSDFRQSFFTHSKRGLRLRGISTGPVTSVTMTSCYANNNSEVGYHFGYLTYCTLVACAGDDNGLTYEWDNAYGCAMIGCGTERSRRAAVFHAYRGVSIQSFFMLNMGSTADVPQSLIEFQSGYGATLSGISKTGSMDTDYVVASTGSSYGGECIVVTDNSIKREEIYQIPTISIDRPIKLLLDKTQRDMAYNISTAEQLSDLLTNTLSNYEINHQITINLAAGTYNLPTLGAYSGRLDRVTGGGRGRVIIQGNEASPEKVIIQHNGEFQLSYCSCYVHILGLTIVGTEAFGGGRIYVSCASNVFVDNCHLLRAGFNAGSAVFARMGSKVIMGKNNIITGPWQSAEFDMDSSSRILPPV